MAHVEWFTREYISRNGVCDKVKYFVVLDGDSPSRTGREYKRQLRRAEKNVQEAKTDAARSANNNFRAGRDYMLTVTLSPEGLGELTRRAGSEEPDALLVSMRKEFVNWVRRAKRRMKGADSTLAEGAKAEGLNYMAWVCDLDGKTGELVQPHIHVLVNAEGMQAMAETWKLGFVFGTGRKLYAAHHGDLTDLVEYVMKQSRQIGTEKRYIPSRNLDKPVATAPRPARNPDAPLRLPKGASLICAEERRAGRPQKVRYYRPDKDCFKAGAKGGADDGEARGVDHDHHGPVRASADRGGQRDRAGTPGRGEPELDT